MTESPTPNKLAKWKRPLIGGLLSAGIVGIYAKYIDMFLDGFSILSIFSLEFFCPPNCYFFSIGNPWWVEILGYGAILLIWFLAGATITYFTRKNWLAIGLWLLLQAIKTFLYIALM